jgi:hypothetical protein
MKVAHLQSAKENLVVGNVERTFARPPSRLTAELAVRRKMQIEILFRTHSAEHLRILVLGISRM